MDHDFWHDKWQKKEIGFHLAETNPLLVAHFGQLGLAPGARVFLPLCGKTRDILWLLSQGFRVVGAELSPLAVDELFVELGLKPTITPAGPLDHHGADGLDVFVGDVFALTREQLGAVDAIYDRAALVALPAGTRARYADHLVGVTGGAPQLLITFQYDQNLLPGPPFSVEDDEVRRHYGHRYALSQVDHREVAGGLKGKCPAFEQVWIAKAAT